MTASRSSKLMLAKHSFFAQLSEGEIDALAAIAFVRKVEAGTVIVRQGEVETNLYAVTDGLLQVSMDLHDAREIVLNLLSPGDMFGQVAVFDQGTRSATVTALKPSSLLAFPHDRLLVVLHEHPSIAIKLLGSMARLVRQLTARAGNLTELPIQLRVARKLLEIAELLGTPVMPNQLALPALVTQQHLANHVQATRESVNRSLSTLVKQGLLQQTKTQLVILDCAGLTRIAGMSTRDLQPTTRNKPTAE